MKLRLIDPMPLLDRPSAGKLLVLAHVCGHRELPLIFQHVHLPNRPAGLFGGLDRSRATTRVAPTKLFHGVGAPLVGALSSSAYWERWRIWRTPSGDGAVVHLVGTVGQSQGALAGVAMREAEIAGDPAAAVGLDGVVDDPQRHLRRGDLDHRDFQPRDLVAGLVHHVGGLQAQQPGHLDVGARLGDALFPDRMLGDVLAEGFAAHQPPAHLLQRHLGRADGAHAVVDAAGTQARLADLEAAAFAEQQVLDRHAHVLQQHLGVAVRRVVVAEHRQHAHDLHAGGVHRHQDLRLLLVAFGLRVGLAHHHRHLAARIAGAGRPPFAAVDHIVSPSRSMAVSMLVASEDATAGSVIRKAERISPFISGRIPSPGMPRRRSASFPVA